MTDRELLELAARAAGKQIDIETFGEYQDAHNGCVVADGEHWNPLKCDGDALRLAVKLGMMAKDSWAFDLMQDFMDWGALDMISATRRAITRAAAQMQLNKENGNA